MLVLIMAGLQFDLARARELASLFFRLTDIPCMITDSAGVVLYHAYSKRDSRHVCDIANFFTSPTKKDDDETYVNDSSQDIFGESSLGESDIPTASVCRQFHTNLMTRARRLGGQFFAFCPLSLTHFGTPIVRKHMIVGALLAGPTSLIRGEDLIAEDLDSNIVSKSQFAILQKHIQDVPLLHPDKAQAGSELMLELSSQLSDDTFSELRKKAHDQIVRLHLFSMLTEGSRTLGSVNDNLMMQEHFMREQALDRAIRERNDKKVFNLITEIQASLLLAFDDDVLSIRSKLQDLLVVISHAYSARGENVERICRQMELCRHKLQATRNIETLLFLFTEYVQKMRYASPAVTIKHTPGIAQKALTWIRQNYERDITLSECAAACHISDSHFSRLIREQTGRSFTDNVNFMRIQAAKILLAQSDEPIANIAQAVGYRDQSYFTRVFRRVEDQTPGSYRDSFR